MRFREVVKRVLPPPGRYLYRFLRDRGDAKSLLRFLFGGAPHSSFSRRMGLIYRMYKISDRIDCPHTQDEIVRYVEAILSVPDEAEGCVVEAGCFQGGSTSKFSIAAKWAGRKLVVFDSFEGLPENEEPHDKNIFGDRLGFPRGLYTGALDEVRGNIDRFGHLGSCEFIKGWFDDTMPAFDRPVAAAYIDVDLASSTYTCLRYLYPLLIPEGRIFSQDGHLPLVIDVFRDEKFWREELGTNPPRVDGLGERKLIMLTKAEAYGPP